MKRMKKFLSAFLALTMTAAMLAGCGSSDQPSSSSQSGDEGTELSGSVSTDGSTSMEDVIGALGEQFKADTGVSVSYNPTGSGSGIEAVANGTCDIGLASRALKDEEKAKGLTETTVALDGIAIIVNSANTVTDLSLEQIADIYTGKINDWSEVGGEAGTIARIIRESGSGTRDGFESITGTEDACLSDQELSSTGAVIEAVRTTPGAIGYASLSAVQDQEGITVLTVGGVAPSEETVLDGTYAIQRPFVFVTRSDEALSDAAQAFFDFATSTDANDLITKAGAVPVAK
jgi:phosphate transport system substrate-binding protein